MRKLAPLFAGLLAFGCQTRPPPPDSSFTTPPLQPANLADSWSAVDSAGRRVAEAGEVPAPRPARHVGMLYFVWLGAHGYDRNRATPDEGVHPPAPGETASPYDLSRLVAANPSAPAYGPDHAFHHWGEPYFGYYVSNDVWVIRQHAQLLADAGVDVIFFDVTNGFIYLPTVRLIAETFESLRREGRSTPSIAFILNTDTARTAQRLYTEFYGKNLHRDLWFFWKGRPLILAKPAELAPEQRAFFSVRESWAWSTGESSAWFADGRDKWPWIDRFPQSFGWHDSPARPEQMPVAAAQHPIYNIGRSYHGGHQPPPGQEPSNLGLHFAEQWERALTVDPEFVLVTGWNEWVAMRFTDGRARTMLGRSIGKTDSYFVDAFSPEFSRDIEPMRGGFGDNYYLQLVSAIRRYKGARPAPRATTATDIVIDGDFADWAAVTASYCDDAGDTTSRDHHGWGRFTRYKSPAGRHDLTQAKIACDRDNVYFCLEAKSPWRSKTLPKDLTLWVRTAAGNFAVNRTRRPDSAAPATTAQVWGQIEPVRVALSGNRLELSLRRSALGLASPAFTLEFKWTDQCDVGTDPMLAYDHGDAAPDGRFFYRFTFAASVGSSASSSVRPGTAAEDCIQRPVDGCGDTAAAMAADLRSPLRPASPGLRSQAYRPAVIRHSSRVRRAASGGPATRLT